MVLTKNKKVLKNKKNSLVFNSIVIPTREFLRLHSELEDPEVAKGICDPISVEFISCLLCYGAISYDDIASKKALVEQIYFDGCFFHAWNRIKDIHIDWTFRQFDPNTPFPYIFHEYLTPDKKMYWQNAINKAAWDMGF